MTEGTQTTARNRLAHEISPYLQQHAHNPVDWRPWDDDVMRTAQAEDKPIMLSVGYSACHWCHVMERESFDDEEIAQLINELFVPVKVDREERPDLDHVYQMVVQLMGRHGGWPLTVFLTPEGKPFFGGTYFPSTDRYGMPGFPTVLRAVSQAYRERRDEVERSAGELTQAIEKVLHAKGETSEIPSDVTERAASELQRMVDEENGGFGSAPKFPGTMNLDVLLRAWKRRGDDSHLASVRKALDAMADGGIHDQLGGGFHRYSVDAHWLVPHFEKMLYDNALLARAYVDGWRVTGDVRYAQVARGTLEYVLREMRSPEGSFYSSQDADSEGEEGKFFVWTPSAIEEVLGGEDARLACLHWGVTPQGNFEEGKSVLHVARSVSSVAEELGLDEDEVRRRLDEARHRLFEAREQRARPFRDEKVIATWNGLMIGAFAEAGGALGEPRYLDAAREALRFVRETLWDGERLLRIYKDGQPRVDAFLEDYGDVACAALDVYEATLDEEAFDFASRLVRTACSRFWDEANGGFFFAPESVGQLVVRPKDSLDTSVPSGTSSMCHALLRLASLTDETDWLERAEQTMRGLVGTAVDNPFGFGHLLAAADRYVNGPTEVVVVGEADDAGTAALLGATRGSYLPDRVLTWVPPDASADASGPPSRIQSASPGQPAAYVCRQRVCSIPVTDAASLRSRLGSSRPEA